MPCYFNVVKVYKKFIINKWYYVISCGIINLMSTKYILKGGRNLMDLSAWREREMEVEEWQLRKVQFHFPGQKNRKRHLCK